MKKIFCILFASYTLICAHACVIFISLWRVIPFICIVSNVVNFIGILKTALCFDHKFGNQMYIRWSQCKGNLRHLQVWWYLLLMLYVPFWQSKAILWSFDASHLHITLTCPYISNTKCCSLLWPQYLFENGRAHLLGF